MSTKATMIAKERLDFSNYVGQEKIINKIKIFISSCVSSDEVLPHMLFNGPGGVGKTSMAYIIAKQMDRPFVQTIGHNIQNANSIVSLFKTAFKDGYAYPIIFIDEIHLIPTKMQQLFYTAMEDLKFSAKSGHLGLTMNYTMTPFTLIGATTNLEKLQGPFISRFVLQFEFEYYSYEDSALIALKYFKDNPIGNMEGAEKYKAATEVASRSRGVARNIVNACYQLKHFILANNDRYDSYCGAAAEEYFTTFEVDPNGLIDIDLQYLEALYNNLPNTVGVEFISALLDRETAYIKTRIEPWLLSLGLVKRTKTGRVITSDGIEALERNNRIAPSNGMHGTIG